MPLLVRRIRTRHFSRSVRKRQVFRAPGDNLRTLHRRAHREVRILRLYSPLPRSIYISEPRDLDVCGGGIGRTLELEPRTSAEASKAEPGPLRANLARCKLHRASRVGVRSNTRRRAP